jgi:hypothetical protein
MDSGEQRFVRVRGELPEGWTAFTQGFGDVVEENARVGCALRIFHMAGKIPLRLDIEALAQEPKGRIERYLAMMEKELCEES